jgi:MFS family permease
VGTVISLPISGLLADTYGWESIFYVFGILALIWTGIWFWAVTENPKDDKWISEEEVNYINSTLSPPSPRVSDHQMENLTSRKNWKLKNIVNRQASFKLTQERKKR